MFIHSAHMGLSENSVPHCTQWFCWSFSLWKTAISLGVYHIFRHTHMTILVLLSSWWHISQIHPESQPLPWGAWACRKYESCGVCGAPFLKCWRTRQGQQGQHCNGWGTLKFSQFFGPQGGVLWFFESWGQCCWWYDHSWWCWWRWCCQCWCWSLLLLFLTLCIVLVAKMKTESIQKLKLYQLLFTSAFR